MRKASIQAAVRERLAMVGYGEGQYGWPKRGRLSVLINADATIKGDAKSDNPMPGVYIELRLPGGMSKRKLAAELANIPVRGPAKPVARAPAISRAMQMEMV